MINPANYKMNINVMELKSRILNFVRMNGPVLPVQVSRAVGSEVLFASAILSELVSYGQVKITKAKIGGSPVYYVAGQEARLQMLEKHLPDVPRKAFALLREKGVLWDKQCSPAERVALREINDFAVQVKISLASGEEIFWKWYMLDDKSAEQRIIEVSGGKEQMQAEVKPEPAISALQQADMVQKVQTGKQAEKPVALHPTAELLMHEVKRTQEKEQFKRLGGQEGIVKEPARKEGGIREKPIKAKEKAERGFEEWVWRFFKGAGISMVEHKIIKKNKEMNITARLPSAVGELAYFVKAKNKKRINDADVSLAYSEAQRHNLPLMLLSNGELTSKAKKFVNEQMRGVVFKRI